MKPRFGQDENGAYKLLDDGRVLRVREQLFNTVMTLSRTFNDPGWSDSW